MSQLIGEDRPLRVCDVCGGIDDHPRHVIGGAPGFTPGPSRDVIQNVLERQDVDDTAKAAALADLADTTLVLRHMSCCRSVGCPDGSCDVVAETVGVELRGADLLRAIQEDESTIKERAAERSALYTDPRSSGEILSERSSIRLNPDEGRDQ